MGDLITCFFRGIVKCVRNFGDEKAKQLFNQLVRISKSQNLKEAPLHQLH